MASDCKISNGFTLIELLLYVGVLAAMLLVVVGFLFLILETRIKNQTVAEVEGASMQVMHLITQQVRNAEAVNSPSPGESSDSLSIRAFDPAKNPAIFNLLADQIRIKERAGPPISITSSRVIASGLNFQNVSRAIKIQFTLSHVNPEKKNEYDYQKTFYGSAALRK